MKKIKHLFMVFLLLGLVFPVLFTMYEVGVFSRPPRVDVLNTVEDENAPLLRVVADFDFSPYSYYDRNNEVCGLDVELVNQIANELGMRSQITFTDWPNCKKLLQNKEADLILGLEIFSHMNGVLKSVPASKDSLVIFGKNKINNIAELKDKKVGLMVNSVITRIFDLNCDFVEFFTNTDILDAVDSGKVDYGICHHSVGVKIIEKNHLKIFSSVELMNSYPAIGIRDDLPELRDRINDIIIKLSNEGFISKIDEKWIDNYTEDKSIKEVFNRQTRFYIIYFIFYFIVSFLFIFLLLHLYHREKEFNEALEYQSKLKKQNDILSSIAGVYNTMHIINLSKNTVKEIRSTDQVREYVNSTVDAMSQMRAVVSNTVIPEDVEAALEFTDLSTIAERFKEKKILLAEFRGSQIGWFCIQFIPISYANGMVEDVVFTSQIIDEMKKENERLLKLSSYDELTKLLNRHSYEEKMNSLKEIGEGSFTVALFDINELKATNDNLSHAAGDELIVGAANCIDSIFSEIGSCYRIGGDEFIFLCEKEIPDMQVYFDRLKELTSAWKGKLVEELHISSGGAVSSEVENFTMENIKTLISIAEKRMYEDKANYYKLTGRERRK
ncbi:diguanylate cyclase domain-containing protein [Treponema sp.]|uniref:diguanylate cyclase domain-containing protein n=1 Tax=Treponema sp. TaxID=166 RepID=UPI00388E0214